MDSKFNNSSAIKRFLRDEMDETERFEFEAAMEQDKDLKLEVLLARQRRAVIVKQIKQAKKHALSRLTSNHIQLGFDLFSGVVLIVLVFCALRSPQKQEPIIPEPVSPEYYMDSILTEFTNKKTLKTDIHFAPTPTDTLTKLSKPVPQPTQQSTNITENQGFDDLRPLVKNKTISITSISTTNQTIYHPHLVIPLREERPSSLKSEDISFEEIKEKCKGLPRENRLHIAVIHFSVNSRAAQATGQFGDELTAIMTNALQQTNCFRVLESTKNAKDLNDELGYNETGATDGGGSKRGQLQGAQAIVTAEITEYNEGRSSVGALGLSMGSNKAKLGLIIKVIDPQTREVVWSKSVNADATKRGFTGASLFGVKVAGSSKTSEAMNAAVEDIVLRTVDIMVNDKEDILSNFTIAGDNKPKQWNKENCKMLSSGNAPKILVIVPEKHVSTTLPDPAGETEILRKFLEAGFMAVDPAIFATLRNGSRFSEAVKNPMAAVSLGKEFGADIVIFGEGFSQLASRDNGTVTCRARVEVKAVRTDNAEILVTNSAQAGGQDLVESTSAKAALKNAGTQIGDYLLGQFCANGISSSDGGAKAVTGSTTLITVQNTNFTKMNNLSAKLKANSKIVKDVTTSLKGAEGTITVVHEGSTDDLATFISTLGSEYEIKDIINGAIIITVK